MNNQKIRPSRGWYFLSIFIFILGNIITIFMIYSMMTRYDDGLTQILVPGEGEIHFNQPGKYKIFHEYKSIFENRVYSTSGKIDGLLCEIKSKSTNEPVELKPVNMNYNYQSGQRKGVALFQFTIDEPGEYIISGKYPENRSEPQLVLAIGDFNLFKLFLMVLFIILIWSSTLLISIGMALFVLFKRISNKKKLQSVSR